MTTKLEQPEVQQFLARPLLAKLVTLNPSGSPQITFMNYVFSDGAFSFSTRQTSIKVRNLGKDPRMAVAIDDPQDPQRGVIANGTATVTGDPAGELLMRVMSRHGRSITPEDARERAKKEGRVVVRMTVKRLRTQGL